MDQWIEERLHSVLSAKSLDEQFADLVRAAELLEFEYFAYGVELSFPFAAPKIELINNYPQAWQEQYVSNNYLLVDPTIQQGKQSIEPFLWSENLFSDARPLWEDAQSSGLQHGWVQSVHGKDGSSGLLTLARSSGILGGDELINKTPLLIWLAQLAHSGLKKHLLEAAGAEEVCGLTPREIEALRWTADGKTSAEIAMILSISDRTVNFHLGSAVKKLQVKNKTAAAVKAAVMGLLF